MLDKDIRAPFLAYLQQADPSAAIYTELRLSRGEGRADCAAVNGSIAGFEIKSDRDSFARLTKQIADYEKVFEFCSIVIPQRHLVAARRVLPRRWGIVLASGSDDRVVFTGIRKPQRNRSISTTSLVRLLWKQEAMAAIRNNGGSYNRSSPIRDLWATLEQLPTATVAHEVRLALKLRAGLHEQRARDDG